MRPVLVATMLFILFLACSSPQALPAPTSLPPTATATISPTRTDTPTPTPKPTLTPTSSPTPTPTYTPLPTATQYPTYTPRPTYTPLPTATPHPTLTPIPTPRPTFTPMPPPPPTATPYPTATPMPPLGNAARPIPLGQAGLVHFSDDSWEIRVVDVVPDAWNQIRAENQFNDHPESGTQFYMVTIALKNVGRTKALFIDSELRTVGNAVGWVYRNFTDSCGVIPNGRSKEVLPTFEFSQNVCWQVATADIPTLSMFWETPFDEDLWFSLGNSIPGTASSSNVVPPPTREPLVRPVPTKVRPVPTKPSESSRSTFCSLENFARIVARFNRAIERGDITAAGDANIELARWADQCG